MSAFDPVPELIRPVDESGAEHNFEVYPDPSTLTSENILDILWKYDDQRMTVSDRDEHGNWRDPDADILLDKQQKAEGSVDSLIDSSPDPLFHTVRPEKLELKTYKTFIELLDNYDAIVNNEEFLDGKELREINDFLDAILETKQMHICFDYITNVLGVPYTWGDYKRKLFAMWFEIHNLRVDEVASPAEVAQKREAAREAARAQNQPEPVVEAEEKEDPQTSDLVLVTPNADDRLHEDDEAVLASPSATSPPAMTRSGRTLVNYCSGFEHVYMGEILRAPRDPSSDKATPKIGNVLGYHNWVKFYIDERVQLVDYLGTKYAKNSLSKIGAPFACIRFRWDQDGEIYVKDRGSFFVGISPEFAMAVATVCYFETYNVASANSCGWEDRSTSSVKFKSRRNVGGYIYDYYICREKKYLVSCFQELIGPTQETIDRLNQEKLMMKMKLLEQKEKATKLKQARTVIQVTSHDGNVDAEAEEKLAEEIETRNELLSVPKPLSEDPSPSPPASPSLTARVIRPKHKPAAFDPLWQAFYSIELKRLKAEDPTLSDKVAFRKAKEAWQKQGHTVPSSGAESKAEAKRARRAAKRAAEDGEGEENTEEMPDFSLNAPSVAATE